MHDAKHNTADVHSSGVISKMATLPTAEQATKHILWAFVHQQGKRPGEILGRLTLIGAFSMSGWRASDIDAGIQHAVDHGWLEPTDPSNSYWRLTDPGFAEAPSGAVTL